MGRSHRHWPVGPLTGTNRDNWILQNTRSSLPPVCFLSFLPIDLKSSPPLSFPSFTYIHSFQRLCSRIHSFLQDLRLSHSAPNNSESFLTDSFTQVASQPFQSLHRCSPGLSLITQSS